MVVSAKLIKETLGFYGRKMREEGKRRREAPSFIMYVEEGVFF